MDSCKRATPMLEDSWKICDRKLWHQKDYLIHWYCFHVATSPLLANLWQNPRTGQTYFNLLHSLEMDAASSPSLLRGLCFINSHDVLLLGTNGKHASLAAWQGRLFDCCLSAKFHVYKPKDIGWQNMARALHFECPRDTKLKTQPVHNFMSRAGNDSCFLHWMMKCCRATPLQRTMSLSASGQFWKPTLQIATIRL